MNEEPQGTPGAGNEPASGARDVSIPAELRARRQWLTWRLETREGKPTKIPYTVTGTPASTTDPATWTSFDEAVAATGFSGVGYVLSDDDGLVGVDFDDCLSEGSLHSEAAALLLALDTYAETSPSGNGVKAFLRASKNGLRRCVTKNTPWGGAFECYERDRFFTVTGQHLPGCPETIVANQLGLNVVLERVFKHTPDPEPAAKGVLTPNDEVVLEYALAAANGDKLRRLLDGDTSGYASDSESDMALVALLAFWTQDAGQLDRLVRGSRLYRAKWDSRRGDTTYGRQTISNVLARGGETYSWPGADYESSARGAEPGELELRVLEGVEAQAVRWLVEGLIPLGTITLVAGIGGLGKSTWLIQVAARASRGEFGKPVDTIILSFEDPAAEVLRPRVEAAGGDLARVHELRVAGDGLDSVQFPRHLDELQRLVRQVDAKLLVVDPIVAAFNVGLDTHKDQHVRLVLARLAALGAEHGCAIAIVGHLNKAPTTDAYLRVANSTAFWNASRSVVLVTEDPEEPEELRLIAQRKANWARRKPVERHRLEEVILDTVDPHSGFPIVTSRMVFVELTDLSADDVLGRDTSADGKTDHAVQMLWGMLRDGEWHESAGLKKLAGALGVTERTLKRAAQDLAVEVERRGFPSVTWWRLPLVGPTEPPNFGPTREIAQPGRSPADSDPVGPVGPNDHGEGTSG